MTGTLDRIEASLRSRTTIGGPDGPELPNWISNDDVLALMEVAKAAQRAERKLKFEYDRLSKRDGYYPPADESWAEGEVLAAALARLEDNQ